MAISQNLEHVAIASHKSVTILSKQKVLSTLNIPYEGLCVEIHSTEKIVAVGAQVFIYIFF